jgi:hypothetical protein
VAILDEASLLATWAYIDLNPVAAGICATPEKSPHTSVKARLEHCKAQGMIDALLKDSLYSSSLPLERDYWLFPVEDRRDPNGSGLAGMLHGVSLAGYLQLLDWSSRVVRPGEDQLGRVRSAHSVSAEDRPHGLAGHSGKIAENHEAGGQLFRIDPATGRTGHTTRLPVPEKHHRP